MPSFNADQRAAEVLTSVGLSTATRAASGRYQRSLPVKPGVRYWATSRPRARQDMLGIQFYGEGSDEALRLGPVLERRGFLRRNPQTGQDTFAKPVPFAADDGVDAAALAGVRRELDAVLTGADAPKSSEQPRTGLSLREFFLASPWADTEIELPERPKEDWRPLDH